MLWEYDNGRIPRAWTGTAEVTFGRSDYEELHLLDPLEVMESYFVYLDHTLGGAGGCRVLHDYLA